MISRIARSKTLFAAAALLLAACGGAAPPAPTSAPAQPAPTEAPKPTDAPAPTEAPKPTDAPAPTEAPKPTEAPAAPAEGGKTVVVVTAEDSVSLDPSRAFEFVPGFVHKHTYQTLVTFPDDSAAEIRPQLAEKWTISDDGKTYTFSLNKAAKFSDGKPVTSKDVLFSFMRLKNIKGNPSSLFAATSIDKIEAKDDNTVVMTLANPNPAVLSILTGSFFSVMNSEAVKAKGGTDAEDADKSDKAEEWLNSNSEGSGPYKLVKWEKKVEVVLERNAAYWGPAPAIERVVIRNAPEAATQKLQLEAGEADIAFDLSADQVPSLKTNDKIKVYEGPGNVVFFLLMNADKAIGKEMADAKVQQAVRLALDYEGIKALTGGKSATPASVIPVGFIGAYGEDKAPKRDLEAAKALLAEAGLDKGLTVALDYPDFSNSGVNFATLAQKIQADLAEAGITVELKGAEVGVWLAAYRDGKSAFTLSLWGPDFLDPGNYLEFLPEYKVGKRANWTNANSDKAIQDIRDKAAVATAPEERVKLFGEMQDFLQKNGPFAPLLQAGTQIGYSSALKGFIYNPAWRVNVALLDK